MLRCNVQAIFSVISIVTQALTLQGAYTGEGHVENIVGCLYSGYFPSEQNHRDVRYGTA